MTMKFRTTLGVIAGAGLLFGALVAFAQQQTSSNMPAEPQSSQMSMGGMMNHMGSHMGMSGMSGNHMMDRTSTPQFHLRATLKKLQAAIEQARTANNPAKLRSALDEAQQEISQLMSHMGPMGAMNNDGGMMMHHSGSNVGPMMGQSPSRNQQQ